MCSLAFHFTSKRRIFLHVFSLRIFEFFFYFLPFSACAKKIIFLHFLRLSKVEFVLFYPCFSRKKQNSYYTSKSELYQIAKTWAHMFWIFCSLQKTTFVIRNVFDNNLQNITIFCQLFWFVRKTKSSLLNHFFLANKN